MVKIKKTKPERATATQRTTQNEGVEAFSIDLTTKNKANPAAMSVAANRTTLHTSIFAPYFATKLLKVTCFTIAQTKHNFLLWG